MKTSYYQCKRLDPARHFIVQTSISKPRWGAKSELALACLAPPRKLLGLTEKSYARQYLAHLEAVGVAAIRTALVMAIKAAGRREPVLCCFESLKTPGQFCHRRLFADWWHERTGEVIHELTEKQNG